MSGIWKTGKVPNVAKGKSGKESCLLPLASVLKIVVKKWLTTLNVRKHAVMPAWMR